MLRFALVSVFDNGELHDQPAEAQRVMDSLMMPMLGQHSQTEKRLSIVRAHDSVVERVFAVRYPCARILRCD